MSIVLERRWYLYGADGHLARLVRDQNQSEMEIFWFYYDVGGRLWISIYGTGDYNEETQAVTNTTLISAAEYRYDGGRQRYMVRLRDPNDDLAIIGDAQWRDYMGNDIHRDYTVDPAVGGGSGGVTNGTSYLAGIGYDDDSANGPNYISGDQIGTTRRIADSNGCDDAPPACSPAILHRKISTAFGEPMSTVNAGGFDAPRYGYAGAWGYENAGPGDPLELLGWLHVGERYYAPELGRFVQRDPIGIRGGLNVYICVLNRPTAGIDASGTIPVWVAEAYLWVTGGNQSWLDNKATVDTVGTISLGVGIVASAPVLAAATGFTAGAATSEGLILVTRWGSPVASGQWVMIGGNNVVNYVLSGKWQPSWLPSIFGNNIFAPFSSGRSYWVPAAKLVWPRGMEFIKGFLGQRICL